eukprot:8114686-Prorocentrum_lima.AAC.1
MRQATSRDGLSLVSPQKVTRALQDMPPLPETFFKVVAMTSDPLLDHEKASLISSAIRIEEGTREPLLPHNA